jgi:prepilin-type N-terminal cleavage/methylation domain-containing protein
MSRRGFSLAEVLLATALAAVALGGGLLMASGMMRAAAPLAKTQAEAAHADGLDRWLETAFADRSVSIPKTSSSPLVTSELRIADPAGLKPGRRLAFIPGSGLWTCEEDDDFRPTGWLKLSSSATSLEALSKGPSGRTGVTPARAGGEPVSWVRVKLQGTSEITVPTEAHSHGR